MSDLLVRGQYAKFNYDSLLRTDTLSRYQAHKIALEAGFLTVNEIREYEDMKPMPEEVEDYEEEDEVDEDLEDSEQQPGEIGGGTDADL